MAGALRKEHRLPLTYIALDWHEMDKVRVLLAVSKPALGRSMSSHGRRAHRG